jgi:hypothetical protein
VTRIGITGHQHLGDAAATAWVRTAIHQVLGEHPGELIGVSSLAAGADQVFAALVLDRQGRLEVVLPFPGYRERSFAEDDDRRGYDRLVARAQVDVLPRDGRSDEEGYLHAGREVVARCEFLVAVWNGAPAGGLGGTADIIAHARERGHAMVILDPVCRTITRKGGAALPARAAQLGDRELEAARQIGDPPVDAVVTDHLACHGPDAMRAAMGALFHTTGLPEDQPLVRSYLGAIGDVELGDSEIIARGQRLFSLFGPEIFLVLGSCSLPLAFACGNGVQAIYRSRRLKDEPLQRLYDTAQMVINVMQVGEFAQGRIGWRSARKVRLIHALVRHHVQHVPAAPWSPSWGTPVNQEDMAGTLLSFSVAVLHCLKNMGARISREEADNYVYAWSAVGRLLGIDEALLAWNEDEALALATRIGGRQIRATPEGKLLAHQLMTAVATLFPIPGYANSLTHYFLQNTAFGADVARVLELPDPNWTRALVAARAWQKRQILKLLDVVPGARRRRSSLARRFVQNMLLSRRPDGTPPFEVPTALATRWGIKSQRAIT